MDPRVDSDEVSLIARARQGDLAATELLFDRHRKALAGRIRSLLPRAVQRRVSVSDVLQETRILAFSRSASFEPRHEGAYRAWLLRIADLKAREALRAHRGTAKRAMGREAAPGGAPSSPGATARDPSPSQAAIVAEARGTVARALTALPPDHREVLRLARLEGLPVREVAERMGRSVEATKKLYGRALAGLARVLDQVDGPP